MDHKRQTIETYDRSARALADKFSALGPRTSDIEETLLFVRKTNPRVLEIGCGNGRDAKIIRTRTTEYTGIDISEGLIELARVNAPDMKFELGDIETCTLPQNLDVVFAFALLIHTPRELLQPAFEKIFDALTPGGVFRLSMKQAEAYQEITKEDEFGVRTYYLYSQQEIRQYAERYVVLKSEVENIRDQSWLEMTLQKPKQ